MVNGILTSVSVNLLKTQAGTIIRRCTFKFAILMRKKNDKREINAEWCITGDLSSVQKV
jgi:hypothetical protein